MRLLLDTHVLLWWQADDPRLGQPVRALIANPDHQAVVSWASFWEISIKHKKGKLLTSGTDAAREALDDQFELLGWRKEHLVALEALPKVEGHDDPFDHLLLAQAKAEDMPLITADRHMTAYGVQCIGVR
jgi:PIN domain nuclease of toxin-antitoxin system